MDGPTYTQRNEGCRLNAYPDQNGVPTIGYGCTGAGIALGVTWTQAQADQQFAQRYANATGQAKADLGIVYWTDLDEVRRAVLVDIAFQDGGGNPHTGVGGLAGYHKTLAAIRNEDWAGARAQCIASANEIETPARCNRNAEMLLTGCWQPGYGG